MSAATGPAPPRIRDAAVAWWGARGEGSTGRFGGCDAGLVRSIRMQAAAVGLAIGGVLSLPALVVLALVTGDAGQTAAAWPAVAGPLLVLGAGLGLLAGGLRRSAVIPVRVDEPPRDSSA